MYVCVRWGGREGGKREREKSVDNDRTNGRTGGGGWGRQSKAQRNRDMCSITASAGFHKHLSTQRSPSIPHSCATVLCVRFHDSRYTVHHTVTKSPNTTGDLMSPVLVVWMNTISPNNAGSVIHAHMVPVAHRRAGTEERRRRRDRETHHRRPTPVTLSP